MNRFTEYKTDCFGYVCKDGYIECSALNDIDCENCKFYRTKEYYWKNVEPLHNKSGGGKD